MCEPELWRLKVKKMANNTTRRHIVYKDDTPLSRPLVHYNFSSINSCTNHPQKKQQSLMYIGVPVPL